MSDALSSIDPLLIPFVHASDERLAQSHLERIISQHAHPIIVKALQSNVRSAARASGDERLGDGSNYFILPEADLHDEVVTALLQRISAIRHQSARPITNFVDYVRRTVHLIFVQHCRDTRIEQKTSSFASSIESDAADTLDLSSLIEQRGFLKVLWDEICELPENQRIALLCNFRDNKGANALPLLALCSVTSPSELAGVLNVDENDLEAFFDRLPMDDNDIAARLGGSATEVRSLRLAARRRLMRRVRAWLV